MFKPSVARNNLKRYGKKGPGAIERRLLASIPAKELEGGRILEIGGGIGVILAELLMAGAQSGEIVELVSGYEPYARELARDKGLEARTRFRVADIMEEPERVARATIVVLNRVVCCSSEGVQLTEQAARLAERVLILSFPRDRFLVRLFVRAVNGIQRLIGRSFRVFLHPRTSLYAAAQTHGLAPAASGQTVAWEFAVMRRV
jgi:magnesium-protoporphyrin O-methyltransferase